MATTQSHTEAVNDLHPRLAGIEHLRGLICLSIVCGHLFLDTLHPLAGSLRPGAECFLVLSGFFLARTLKPASRPFSLRRFADRRLRRLIIPYAIALTAGVVLPYLAADFGRLIGYPPVRRAWPAAGTFIADYLAALFCVSDIFGRPVPGAFWSMVVLLQATVLLSTLFSLLRLTASRFGVGADRTAFAVLTVLVGCGFVASLSQTTSRDYQSWWMTWSFAYLAAGWLLAAVTGNRARFWTAGAVGLLLIAQSFVASRWPASGGMSTPYRPLFATAMVLALAALSRWGDRPVSARLDGLAAVGRRSYSLYLTHMTAAYFVIAPANRLGWHSGPISSVVVPALSLAAAGVAGWAFYRLVERPMAGRQERTPQAAPDTRRLKSGTTRLSPVTPQRPSPVAAADNTSGQG